jgi:hypothetical protein
MRARPELAFFALALVCVAAIAVPFVRCGSREEAAQQGTEQRVVVQSDNPRAVGEEMVRRFLTYDGDHAAWQASVLELATEPLRSRVAARAPDQALQTYGVSVRVTGMELVGLQRDGDRAEVLLRVRARATPSRPGGEWSVPRETTRTVHLYLTKEGERWLVSEMALQE